MSPPVENPTTFSAVGFTEMKWQELVRRLDEGLAEWQNEIEAATESKLQPIPWRESTEETSMTPRKLFMHTVTHEYHHKGQIMAMARQLGYEPPNTDVLGTRD